MYKHAIIKSILEDRLPGKLSHQGSAFAPTNIALCKYWGKRDEELNLPITSSLSLTLLGKGAFTRIKHADGADCYIVNGAQIPKESRFAARLKNFLDLFRLDANVHYLVETELNIPVSAGIASSASGFAALVLALNELYGWHLCKQKLSILARLGSGSACRSLWPGFVEWQAGSRLDGMDSFGISLPYVWSELRLGLLILSRQEKSPSSREAMRLTVQNSPLYSAWPGRVALDLGNLKRAILQHDFELFGETAEANAMMMHEMMLQLDNPIDYFLPETHVAIWKIRELRLTGIPVFFTQDAGPNVHLLFLKQDSDEIKEIFPMLEIVAPFADSNSDHVVLVDDQDRELGVCDKMQAHLSGDLHRGFSIFVLRHHANAIEILLQKRAADKYHSSGLWSNTCCGHPYFGEEVAAAASRRLREEMGFGSSLKHLGFFHYKLAVDNDLCEHEIDHVFVGMADIGQPPLNPKEVQDCCWITLANLKQDLALHGENYTPWLPLAYNLLLQKLGDFHEFL